MTCIPRIPLTPHTQTSRRWTVSFDLSYYAINLERLSPQWPQRKSCIFLLHPLKFWVLGLGLVENVILPRPYPKKLSEPFENVATEGK